jgi:hypothetical protein
MREVETVQPLASLPAFGRTFHSNVESNKD